MLIIPTPPWAFGRIFTHEARLKLLCVMHLGLGVAHNVRLLPALLTRLGLR